MEDQAEITISIRFYSSLVDFLRTKNNKPFLHFVSSHATIKDIIESLGVPHPEVELILANSHSVPFTYRPKQDDYISVYPAFTYLNVTAISYVKPKPLKTISFILDAHLGKLTKHLRLLGFDVIFNKNFSDQEISLMANSYKKIVLSRDIGLLKNKMITYGYWIRNDNPIKQLNEILLRFDLYQKCKPFTRCLICNGKLIIISKQLLPTEKIPKDVLEYQKNFTKCDQCQKYYWEGTHFIKLRKLIKNVLTKNI